MLEGKYFPGKTVNYKTYIRISSWISLTILNYKLKRFIPSEGLLQWHVLIKFYNRA